MIFNKYKDTLSFNLAMQIQTIILRPCSLRLLKLNNNVKAFQSNKNNALFREIANMFKLAELMKFNNHEGTQTHNVQIQSQTPYPLGHTVYLIHHYFT